MRGTAQCFSSHRSNNLWSLPSFFCPSSSTVFSERDSAFLPEPNVPFQVGKETACVCPNLVPFVCPAEKFCGRMVTKLALEATDSPIGAELQIMAGCTSTTPLVGTLQSRLPIWLWKPLTAPLGQSFKSWLVALQPPLLLAFSSLASSLAPMGLSSEPETSRSFPTMAGVDASSTPLPLPMATPCALWKIKPMLLVAPLASLMPRSKPTSASTTSMTLTLPSAPSPSSFASQTTKLLML